MTGSRALRLHLPGTRPAWGSDHWGSCVVSPQVLPFEALVTDTGEVTEVGKAYVPPRVLQEAPSVISGVPGLEGGAYQHGTAGTGDADHLSPPILRSVAQVGGWGRDSVGRAGGQKASKSSLPFSGQQSASGQHFSPG